MINVLQDTTDTHIVKLVLVILEVFTMLECAETPVFVKYASAKIH